MKIDVWADYLCPYCYVSIRTLDEALKKTGKSVEYVHHGYLLNPEGKNLDSPSHYEWMAGHLDMTVEEAKKRLAEGIGKKAAANGIPFHPEKAIPADTRAAHLLSYYAQDKGLAQEAVTRFARAYYELGEDLNDDATLQRIAEEIGLGKDALETVRNDPQYEQRLADDRKGFVARKIESIPDYVINDEVHLPESKHTEEFVEILNKYDG